MTSPDFEFREAIERIKRIIPFEELAGRYVKLNKVGRDFVGLCPFRPEKTASLHVYSDHCHCFGCNYHGDHFDFLQEVENIDFGEALRRLAAQAGVQLPNLSQAA